MKKTIGVFLFLAATVHLFAQTEGISYQAVIIGPEGEDIPGVNAEGNILPEASVAIRFTLMDQNNTQEYQEVQMTRTDRFGRVNLVIGSEDPDGFSLVNWDGTSKSLKVDIDFSGSGGDFVDMSRQELNFVPYSFHRDIIARGTLVVDDITDLNGELTVAGPTNLNSTLSVNNKNSTSLSGPLMVGGTTDFDSSLFVGGIVNLDNGLNVNNSTKANFSGDITVGGLAQFDGDTKFDNLNVDGTSAFGGQVTINTDMGSAGDTSYAAYPLRVEGSQQGIAIKVNQLGTTNNNFMTFWDNTRVLGRIEGQTESEMRNDSEWKAEHATRWLDVGVNSFEVISVGIDAVMDLNEAITRVADVRPVVSIAPGATVPSPTRISVQWVKVIKVVADVIAWIANEAMAITELVHFNEFTVNQVGISFQSGGADYAEWLPKENPDEKFIKGELVGIRNGFVSKRVFGADKVMVISSNPIVIGNMPTGVDESKYEKIAFMGQVPVRVFGPAEPGDYILPSELSNGFGKAVHPEKMTIRDYKKIVGVAWEKVGEPVEGLNIVNVAVGINNNDLSNVVADQAEELLKLRTDYDDLNRRIIESNIALAQLLPGYTELLGYSTSPDIAVPVNKNENQEDVLSKGEVPCVACPDEEGIITIVISRDEVDAAIEIARDQYQEMLDEAILFKELPGVAEIRSESNKSIEKSKSGIPENLSYPSMEEHPFWSRMNNDPDYKEEIIQFVKSSVENSIQKQQTKGEQKFRIEYVNF